MAKLQELNPAVALSSTDLVYTKQGSEDTDAKATLNQLATFTTSEALKDPIIQGYSKVTNVSQAVIENVDPEGTVRKNELFLIDGINTVFDFSTNDSVAIGSKWTFIINYDSVGDPNARMTTNSVPVNGEDPTHTPLNIFVRGSAVTVTYVGVAGYVLTAGIGAIKADGPDLYLNYTEVNRIDIEAPQAGGDVHKVRTYVNDVLTFVADENGTRARSIATGTLSPVATEEDLNSAAAGVASFNSRSGIVVPQSNDYATSDVENDSNVYGSSPTLSGVLEDIKNGKVESIAPGANVTITDTDPLNPIISFSGVGGGTSDDITNLSTISGTDITDALNAIAPSLSVDAVFPFLRRGFYNAISQFNSTTIDLTSIATLGTPFTVGQTGTTSNYSHLIESTLDIFNPNKDYEIELFYDIVFDTSALTDPFTVNFRHRLSGGNSYLDFRSVVPRASTTQLSFLTKSGLTSKGVPPVGNGLGITFDIDDVDIGPGLLSIVQFRVTIMGYYG